MARVVILEPDPQVEALLVQVVAAGADEPCAYRCAADLDEADAVVLEPEFAAGLEAVRRLRVTRTVPVVCVSIAPQDERSRSVSATYVAKPFELAALRSALAQALNR